MFATPAFAQAAGAAPASGGFDLTLIFPIVAFVVFGYFLIWRPQQKSAKDRRALLEAIKRGDTVVLSSGIIGKIARVEDAEVPGRDRHRRHGQGGQVDDLRRAHQERARPRQRRQGGCAQGQGLSQAPNMIASSFAQRNPSPLQGEGRSA